MVQYFKRETIERKLEIKRHWKTPITKLADGAEYVQRELDIQIWRT